MEIRRLIRKNKTIQEDETKTFYSFKEVFDWCLDYLRTKVRPLHDDIVFDFKILDTNETFRINGGVDGETSRIDMKVYFDCKLFNIPEDSEVDV